MNGFKQEEIVRVQGKEFPVLGGRLRIAHELFKDRLSIETELIDYAIDSHAVVRARVETPTGVYSATGTATAARDPKLADSLLELAESRACARALRLSGVGTETCGYEEVACREGEDPVPFPRERVKGPTPSQDDARPARIIPGPPATAAQRRCLETLAKKIRIDPYALVARYLPGAELDQLTLREASKAIEEVQSRIKNGNGHGETERR